MRSNAWKVRALCAAVVGVCLAANTSVLAGDLSWDRKVAATDVVVNHTDIALDSGAIPHAVYSDAHTGEIIYTHFDGTVWHSSVVGVGDQPQLALDDEKRPAVAWNSSAGLSYAELRAGAWQAEVVRDIQSWPKALEFDAMNRPAIAANLQYLPGRVIRRNDETWEDHVLPDSGNTKVTDMVLGADDNASLVAQGRFGIQYLRESGAGWDKHQVAWTEGTAGRVRLHGGQAVVSHLDGRITDKLYCSWQDGASFDTELATEDDIYNVNLAMDLDLAGHPVNFVWERAGAELGEAYPTIIYWDGDGWERSRIDGAVGLNGYPLSIDVDSNNLVHCIYPNTDDHTLVYATTTIPEPATMALLGLGGLALIARRRRNAAAVVLLLAGVAVVFAPVGNASADTFVYRTDPPEYRMGWGSMVVDREWGCEVELAGAERHVTELMLVADPPNGGTMDVAGRIYANDGQGGEPGSLLWDSGWRCVSFADGDPLPLTFEAPGVLVPDRITAVLAIENISNASYGGMERTDNITVGTVHTRWSRLPGSDWVQGLEDGTSVQMHVLAIPEPATIALLGLGGFVLIARRRRNAAAVVLLLAGVAVVFAPVGNASADTFGEGENRFEIEFVSIPGQPNPEHPIETISSVFTFTGTETDFRIGVYEITNDQWSKFESSLGVPVNGSARWAYGEDLTNPLPNRPTRMVSWYEAAQFVNWLNTSTGHQAAYRFTGTQGTSDYTFRSWPVDQRSPESSLQHKDAYYFLPSDQQWAKAAYWNGEDLQTYATKPGESLHRGDSASGTGWNYDGSIWADPWDVGSGSEELNGTYDMMGNVMEWTGSPGPTGMPWVSCYGGNASSDHWELDSAQDGAARAFMQQGHVGFRVASVPEPATLALLTVGGLAMLTRRRR